MNYIVLIGSVAACLTTAAFVPQVVKAHTSKQTKDISIAMCLFLASGVALWTVYGVFIGSYPVILANSATLVLALYLIFLKVKYG